jgi:hypothetical protein
VIVVVPALLDDVPPVFTVVAEDVVDAATVAAWVLVIAPVV